MDVQMADVQCDLHLPNERVAYLAALQVVPTTLPAMPAAAVEVETGQPVQIDMATSIRHQPRGLRHRTCTILKKLLQHHTHCHHQWTKRRDSESLQAEFAAARWAWLGPT